MKRILIVFFVMLLLTSAAGAQTSQPKKTKAATLNFFLLDRIPRNILKGTITPLGGDYFTAERYGLESTMSRLFNEVLSTNSSYKVAPTRKPAVPDPAVEDTFLYYVSSENPQDYFDKNKLAAEAEALKADVLIVGLVQQLDITKNIKEISDNSVKMKVSVLVYETATGTFTQAKTYEKETKQVNGLPDFDLLPKKNNKVPPDILKFAESETGRVFLDMLPAMIEELPEGKKMKPFLSGEYNYPVKKQSKSDIPDARVIIGDDNSPDKPPKSKTLKPACDDDSLIVLTAPAGKTSSIKVFPCKAGHYDYSLPYIETAPVTNSKRGLGSLCAGDFNGDGSDELAVASLEPGQFIDFYSIKDRTFTASEPFQSLSTLMPDSDIGLHAAAGDFNGDGRDELAISADRSNDRTIILEYSGGKMGPAAAESQLIGIFGVSGHGANIAAGDFDGNGRDDIAIASDGGGETVKIFSYFNGLTKPAEKIAELADYFNGTTDSTSIAAGDFDGNGRDELVLSSLHGGVSVKVLRYEMNSFDTENPMGEFSVDWEDRYEGARVATGDFDGDGVDELAMSTTGGKGALWIFKYKKGRFALAAPYLDEAAIYEKATNGILVTVGNFK